MNLPSASEVVAIINRLIPEGRPYHGMAVEVRPASGDVRGYYVELGLMDEVERVGGKALSDTLADWHESKSGDLPEMVAQAVMKLTGRAAAKG